MEVKFNVSKEERKAFVAAVGEITGWGAVYKGAPSFAFAVNNYTIDRNGTLVYDERTNVEEVRSLLTGLAERGFVFESDIGEITPVVSVLAEGAHSGAFLEETASVEASASEASDRLVIEVPLEGFTRTAFDNLEKLINGKTALIMKAIGADTLPIERSESTLQFPWFTLSASAGEVDAYTRFVCALCNMAKKQKRVTLKESDVDSEKFAFRCFLLRLGFVGKEFAQARKILLSKLSGNGSFKSGDHKRSGAQEGTTRTDSGEENVEAISVREDDSGANSAATCDGGGL